jgi:drug/metabolite transporter (DMT)-like permease
LRGNLQYDSSAREAPAGAAVAPSTLGEKGARVEPKAYGSYYMLGAGIVAISFGAIFVRLAGAPAPLVASLRMIFASLVLLPMALFSRPLRAELSRVAPKDTGLLALAGLFLALHFMLWISSLSFTGVTSSVVFVNTNPLFVALYAIVVFRERVARTFWYGLGLAFIGGLIIGGKDLLGGGARWQGDLLALGGAAAVAGYFLVGSRLRKRLTLLAYVFPVYSAAAVLLLAAALVARVPFTGYAWPTYLYCFLLALVCQIIGHSLFNYALKHLHATVVTIAVIGEPVGASLLAMLILREMPGPAEIIGGASILCGIGLVLYYSPGVVPPKEEMASGG